MEIKLINNRNFQELVMESDKPVLLDFWASWCGPCRMIAPYIEEIAREREDILVGKINVDEELELSARFGITSIPTLIVIKNCEVAATALGYRPKADIEKLL